MHFGIQILALWESIKYKFLKTLGPTMILRSRFEFESLHQDLDPLQKPQVSPVLKLSFEPSHKNKSLNDWEKKE